jgi:hypothetical protein
MAAGRNACGPRRKRRKIIVSAQLASASMLDSN